MGMGLGAGGNALGADHRSPLDAVSVAHPAYHIDDRVAAVAANVERAVRRNIKALGIVELVVRGSSNPLLARDIGRLYV